MAKKRAGPEGPDHLTEPLGLQPHDAATPQDTNSSFLTQLDGAGSPPAGSGLCRPPCDDFPTGPVMYDTSWVDQPGSQFRVVFSAGPPNLPLREWVRAHMFSPVSVSDEETELDE